MYLVTLQGHAASSCPGCNGAPTECTQGTKSPLVPSISYTLLSMRVMMRLLTATLGESDSSTPRCEIGEPSGPIEYGTTYRVRPRLQPSIRVGSVRRISSVATQLL